MRRYRILYAGLAAACALARPASAGDPVIWDNNTGNSTWNTTSPNWHKVGDGNGTAIFVNGDHATFSDSATPVSVAIQGAGVQVGSMTVSNTSGTYAFTGGAISGTGTLVKSSSGTLTLSQDNTGLSGGMYINGTGYTYFNAAVALGSVGSVRIAKRSLIDINFAGLGGSSSAGDLSRINPTSTGASGKGEW